MNNPVSLPDNTVNYKVNLISGIDYLHVKHTSDVMAGRNGLINCFMNFAAKNC